MKITPRASKAQNSNGFLKFIKIKQDAMTAVMIEIFNQKFFCIVTMVINIEITMPTTGASKINKIVGLCHRLATSLCYQNPSGLRLHLQSHL